MPSLGEIETLVEVFVGLEAQQAESGKALEAGVEDIVGERLGHKRAQDEERAADGEGGETGETSGSPTENEVFNALRKFSNDVTLQFAALEILREHFEVKGSNAEFQALLDEANVEFEKNTELARDVRAGRASAKDGIRQTA
jgi:hypothetical protein